MEKKLRMNVLNSRARQSVDFNTIDISCALDAEAILIKSICRTDNHGLLKAAEEILKSHNYFWPLERVGGRLEELRRCIGSSGEYHGIEINDHQFSWYESAIPGSSQLKFFIAHQKPESFN